MEKDEFIYNLCSYNADSVQRMAHKDMVVHNCCLMRIANPALSPRDALEQVFAMYQEVEKAFADAKQSHARKFDDAGDSQA